MKEGKEPLRTFGDLIQFYQHQSSQDAPAASQMKAERGTVPAKAEESEPTQATASRHETAESASAAPVVSQPSIEPAQVVAEKPPHASNGAEAASQIEATQTADRATGAAADSTV